MLASPETIAGVPHRQVAKRPNRLSSSCVEGLSLSHLVEASDIMIFMHLNC